jgi:DNA-directed RNA polymerase subunit M/transcription elongation factor TFIIS
MLPKNDVPIHTVQLPLLKKKIRYRPFLVKEEKILLMAKESEDEKTVLDAIRQVVNNCCLDEIDVDSIPILDLEYLFLQLRIKSVGEISTIHYKCNNVVEKDDGTKKQCGNVVKLEIDISDINPKVNKKNTNKIDLGGELGVVMKYPSFSIVEVDGDKKMSEYDKSINIISQCIDYVYDSDTIYYSKDIPKEELVEFIEQLTQEQFEKIGAFFNSIPKIEKDVEFKCDRCGYTENITVEGLQNFFV